MVRTFVSTDWSMETSIMCVEIAMLVQGPVSSAMLVLALVNFLDG